MIMNVKLIMVLENSPNPYPPLSADSVEKMKESLTSMRNELEKDSFFKEIYAYAFQIARTDGQKNLGE